MTTAASPAGRAGDARDPVIEAYLAGIDRTLLRHNLTLTPTQRVEQLVALQRLAEEARKAGKAR